MTSILATQNFLENWDDFYVGIPCRSKNSSKIDLSHTVIEIEAYLCFAILGKKSKIQVGHHFWGDKSFLENWDGYSADTPRIIQKFR